MRSTRREYDLAIRGLGTALHRAASARLSLDFARKRVWTALEAHNQWLADQQKRPGARKIK